MVKPGCRTQRSRVLGFEGLGFWVLGFSGVGLRPNSTHNCLDDLLTKVWGTQEHTEFMNITPIMENGLDKTIKTNNTFRDESYDLLT